MHWDSLAKRGKKSTSSSSSLNIRRARKATQEGLYSKAIKALTSEGLAQPGSEILEEMLNKHPQAPPPTLPPGPPPSPTLLPESIIFRSVKSFPNASAAGPSGLRPSHLREAILCPSPDRAGQILSSLSRFVNLLASGRAPISILSHLCGATLLACRKKSGGHRPIAVGEVLRRLTSKCLSYSSRSTVTSTLTPLQLGVGVKGGCEAIIHATSHLLSSTSSLPRPTNLGASSWTFPTPSIASIGRPCSGNFGTASLTYPLGWSLATPASSCSTLTSTLSAAAVEYNKEIPWVL